MYRLDTDNAPNAEYAELKIFLNNHCVKYILSASYYPTTNAER